MRQSKRIFMISELIESFYNRQKCVRAQINDVVTWVRKPRVRACMRAFHSKGRHGSSIPFPKADRWVSLNGDRASPQSDLKDGQIRKSKLSRDPYCHKRGRVCAQVSIHFPNRHPHRYQAVKWWHVRYHISDESTFWQKKMESRPYKLYLNLNVGHDNFRFVLLPRWKAKQHNPLYLVHYIILQNNCSRALTTK